MLFNINPITPGLFEQRLKTPLLIPSESHQNTMKMKTCGNMYTKRQNPKFENHSLKTLEIRPLQSLA